MTIILKGLTIVRPFCIRINDAKGCEKQDLTPNLENKLSHP